MELNWHAYKYYPYEYDLARREVSTLLGEQSPVESPTGLKISTKNKASSLDRLVYFSSYGPTKKLTDQAKLEFFPGSQRASTRQSTRYSAHGLHEYKGKFNPQVPKAILNIFGMRPGQRVLDPFCGSGTSLVEASHLGLSATGTDINPLAVFIANAKLASLQTDPDELRKAADAVLSTRSLKKFDSSARGIYLESWFDEHIFHEIERLKVGISKLDTSIGQILAVCASNLLREYSQQDPMDLRIRRRSSAIPEQPIAQAFAEQVETYATRISLARAAVVSPHSGQAILLDSRDLSTRLDLNNSFDCALTSPPYAMALPYIDTQRLSLVWLGLVDPSSLAPLESRLVGSREYRGIERKTIGAALLGNIDQLPSTEAKFCIQLLNALSDTDGFRRRAVPTLLYRYFSGMACSFRGVRSALKKKAPYALVVGGNHTVLGGQRFDIDTPKHLASIAEMNGWSIREIIPLQTYQRYGYHMNNAVANESMVILEAS
jgi:hypothetical protein